MSCSLRFRRLCRFPITRIYGSFLAYFTILVNSFRILSFSSNFLKIHLNFRLPITFFLSNFLSRTFLTHLVPFIHCRFHIQCILLLLIVLPVMLGCFNIIFSLQFNLILLVPLKRVGSDFCSQVSRFFSYLLIFNEKSTIFLQQMLQLIYVRFMYFYFGISQY